MNNNMPLNTLFLGAKAENADLWNEMIQKVFSDYIYWRRNYFPNDPIILGNVEKHKHDDWVDDFDISLQSMLNKLKGNFPFYHPRYMAHMLSEISLPSVLGYIAGILYNPNNVTSEAAPVTVNFELEFGDMICKMLGYTNNSWAHICSGGTIANIEALWVAREVQFMPLIIQEYCRNKRVKPEFNIKLPNSKKNERVTIDFIEPIVLLSLKPNESIFMLKNFLEHLIKFNDRLDAEKAVTSFNDFVKTSTYSVRHRGFYSVLKSLKASRSIELNPVIFVTETAHYSVKKAASILGYGEDTVRLVPIDNKFRMDIKKFKDMIHSIKKNEYIAAVLAVVGSTEEGAVDPVHEIKFIRDWSETELNRSFWLHVDAAWGGYIRSLFVDDNLRDISSKSINDRLNAIAEQQIINMNMTEDFEDHYRQKNALGGENKVVTLGWNDREVIKAFIAMPSADSITVDPHKLGFIPYPAGLIAFKNKDVAQLVAQKANYISEDPEKIGKFNAAKISEVGPHILEGSKPGSAAVACWLSAKTIPLDLHNHGKIIKTTILNAQRLHYYLQRHQKTTFFEIDKELGNATWPKIPFRFVMLYDNIDTNLLCFIVMPMKWKRNDDNNNRRPKMVESDWTLNDLNLFNEDIYAKFTVANSSKEHIINQRFFLSRTKLEKDQYVFSSVEGILKRFEISKAAYEREGLFVLRATIMNPWHYTALNASNEERRIDYLMEFIKELHSTSRYLLNDIKKHPSSSYDS